MLFLDTETCGLTGPIIIIQYQLDNESPKIHHVWSEPVHKTLRLIEWICQQTVCAYNLTFDWFQLTKLYNLLSAQNKSTFPNPEVVANGNQRIFDYALRPKGALDLYSAAKKTAYQELMSRDEVRIRRVPNALSWILAEELKARVKLESIYFARGTQGYEWKVEPIEHDPRFCNIVLRFKATLKLKKLCSHIFKTQFQDYPLPISMMPEEQSFNPYSTGWLEKINEQIKFWKNSKAALSYAQQDIILLQRLYEHLNYPSEDDDSILACAVGCARWLGFSVDESILQEQYNDNQTLTRDFPINYNSHPETLRYITASLSDIDKLFVTNTTKKTLLFLSKRNDETAKRASSVLQVRKAKKVMDNLTKLIYVKRFCPDFNIIGARSGRMSGGSGEFFTGSSINPQGMQRNKSFRSIFTLADSGQILSGGDFEQFELSIAEAVYKDSQFTKDLQSGRSIHATLGTFLYDKSYDDVLSSKNSENNLYNPAKNTMFAWMYGAEDDKLATTAGVSIEKARLAKIDLYKRYPKVQQGRQRVYNLFCSMSQPNGLGTQVIWRDAAKYVETLFGFRRYFTLENRICQEIFSLANNPPNNLRSTALVNRSKRQQTEQGAVQSALYSACFQIQAANMRAAANHEIQGTGGQITKTLQAALWLMQPVGASKPLIKTLNIHDEILAVHSPKLHLEPVVDSVVEDFRKYIPFLAINWKKGLKNWAEK